MVKIGTEALYPPFESFAEDNKTIVGLDPDLANALGQVLGIEVTMTHTAFDGLLTALDGGRFDLVMAAITDTKARQAKYDFVDYFTTGQAIVVKKGNPESITAIEDLCGKNVSVLVASTQEKLLGEFNADQCAPDKIKVTALPNDKDALLQVRTGRADANFTQDAVGRYNSRTIGGGNQFEVANSEPMLPVPVGHRLRQGRTPSCGTPSRRRSRSSSPTAPTTRSWRRTTCPAAPTRTPPSTAEPPDGAGHVIERRTPAARPPVRPSGDSEPIKAVPVRHWGQWVSAVVVLVLVAALVYSVATNDNLQWSVVGENLTEQSVLRGLWVTIQLTVLVHGRWASCSGSWSPSCGCRATRCSAPSAGSTSGSSAARRCSSSCSSGSTWRCSSRRSASARSRRTPTT